MTVYLTRSAEKLFVGTDETRRENRTRRTRTTHTHTRRRRDGRGGGGDCEKGGHDDDDKTAANGWRLPRGCSRDSDGGGYGGGDGSRRRQNYYYYCYYDTRRGEYCNTTHVPPAPDDRYEKYKNRETPTSSARRANKKHSTTNVIFSGAVSVLIQASESLLDSAQRVKPCTAGKLESPSCREPRGSNHRTNFERRQF
ncbi:hypothetical protein ACI65C_009357 [Semiaphis heraclei]